MASFQIQSGVSGLYLTLTYTVGAYDINANTTPVTISLALTHGGLSVGAGTDDCKVWIGSQSYSWTGPDIYSSGGTVSLGSKTFNVPHNADGTWSGTIGGSYRLNIRYAGTYIGTIGGEQDGISLPTIPRASSFSVGNITIGADNTVTINRASDGFIHRLTLTMGDRSLTVENAGASATLTPPMEWCNGITSSAAASGTLKLETYNGSQKIGETSDSVTLLVPASVVPTVTATAELVNGFQGLYLQGRSKAKIVSAGTGAYGSTIKSYSVAGAGYSGNGATYTTGLLNVTGDVNFAVTVVDSRGRTGTANVKITVIAYSKPTITVQSLSRCDSNGNVTESGTYARVQATYTCASVNGKNAISCNVYYRKSGASSWSGSTAIVSGTAATVFGGNLAITDTYEIRFYATDAVGEHAEAVQTISSSANYLFAGRPGIVGINGYPDLTKKGTQIIGDEYISGNVVRRGSEQVATSTSASGTGQNGYIKVAQIVIKTLYTSTPMTFTLVQREMRLPYQVCVKFVIANTVDPELETIVRTPTSPVAPHVYIVKSATSTWDMWVKKTYEWDIISILDVRQEAIFFQNEITYPFTFATALPSGATEATEYLNATRLNGLPISNWEGVPPIYGGVMEIGRYIDFHTNAGGTEDYTHRLESGADTTLHLWGGSRYLDAYIDWSNVKNVTIGSKEIFQGSTSGAISFTSLDYPWLLVEGKVGSNDSLSSTVCYSWGYHLFSDESHWYAFSLDGNGISAKTGGSGVITRVVGFKIPEV
nr:MAG TPA: protein of unknown function DUF859 [Caudoviricetes sp.]